MELPPQLKPILAKLKKVKLPFVKPKESIAIDIGSYSVKIVQLKLVGNKWTLLRYFSVPTVNPAMAEITPVEKRQLVVDAILKIFSEQKITLKDVITSVSGNSVIVRYVKLPKLNPEQLAKTIQFEAEPFIPFPIQDVNISFQILGDVTEDGAQKMETILVAAKKEIIQNKIDILIECGLKPVVVDVDSFAIENALSLNTTQEELNQVYLVINCGTTTTNISIVEDGTSRVVRDVFTASSSFTKALQRNLQIDWKTAEEKKMKFGILVTPEEKEEALAQGNDEALQLSTILMSPARELVAECQRSIDFYQTQSATERQINKVYLCGGGSLLSGLDKYISAQVHLPVEILNPFAKIADELVLSSEDPKNFTQYAVAVGLATRKRGDL
ncbi:MAG: type IV pilus assembly protein PilM [Elusimicrobia bacterium]|nr:type IV pilus assembly protein PilM [Elusimicrobiota bacterium]